METNKTYKRQDRSVSPETAQKISNSLRAYNATHPRNAVYSKRISDGLRNYWEQIPQKSDNPIKNGNIV